MKRTWFSHSILLFNLMNTSKKLVISHHRTQGIGNFVHVMFLVHTLPFTFLTQVVVRTDTALVADSIDLTFTAITNYVFVKWPIQGLFVIFFSFWLWLLRLWLRVTGILRIRVWITSRWRFISGSWKKRPYLKSF